MNNKRNHIKYFALILVCTFFNSCSTKLLVPTHPIASYAYNSTVDTITMEKKEIRAAWITTVANSDWPKKKRNAKQQKKDLIEILDKCQELNFNAAILQVRPTADAFYPSQLEPWSYYLTGTQGKNPEYDPLLFAVNESHKRGMEFHAWLNPYRIGWDSIPLASNHIAVKHPEWVITFGRNRYFDPGIPEVRSHLVAVVKDMVSKYNVDAIHFDDYFYPFGSKVENPFVFNDSLTYVKYGLGQDITTWRNNNVSTMVKEVYEAVKSVNSKVLFGISPAGRRENSFALYADPFEWLEKKWVDYLAPQIYWEFGHKIADFGRLADFWDENSFGVPMVLGIAAYRYKSPSIPAFGSLDQFQRQISYVRSKQNLHGVFYFRTESILNTDLFPFLKDQYKYKSLVPKMGTSPPLTILAPVVKAKGNKISWSPIENAKNYAIYVLIRDDMSTNSVIARCIGFTEKSKIKLEKGKFYVVTSVGEGYIESSYSNIVVTK